MSDIATHPLLPVLTRIAHALEQLVAESAFGAPAPQPPMAEQPSGAAAPSLAVTPATTPPVPVATATPGVTPAQLPQPAADPGPDRIASFLEQLGIECRGEARDPGALDSLMPIAVNLGDNYELLKPLLAQIRRHMQAGGSFSWGLDGLDPVELGRTIQFGHQLHGLGMLSEFRYLRHPQRRCHYRASSLPAALNFFAGRWLELYVRALVGRLPTVALRPNVLIETASGDRNELDLLFSLDDEIWWVESKSGDHQAFLPRYQRLARTLALPPERALLVVPDLEEHQAHHLSAMINMTCVNLDGLADIMAKLLAAQMTTPPPQPTIAAAAIRAEDDEPDFLTIIN